jgi:tRNA(fMet)-specific endonuclease VapC
MMMARYLFDADALSFITGNRLRHYPEFAEFLQRTPREQQFTCAPVVGELYAGAHNYRDPAYMVTRIEMVLQRLTIVPLDRTAAEKYGSLRADLQKKGDILHDMDLLIAACALTNGMTLVTGNEKHFSRIRELPLWVVYPNKVQENSDALYQAAGNVVQVKKIVEKNAVGENPGVKKARTKKVKT